MKKKAECGAHEYVFRALCERNSITKDNIRACRNYYYFPQKNKKKLYIVKTKRNKKRYKKLSSELC